MTWAEAEERFAESLPGYEPRAQQTRLALTIEQTLTDGERLLAQAGCGTGKSLAAMVPAIDFSLATGETVLVSTATKALQDQYAGKDAPFLAQNLGKTFSFALLKGRSNYFCRQKASEVKPGQTVALTLRKVEEELDGNAKHTGDRGDFITDIDDLQWRDLSSTSEECPGKNDCPFGEVCFAEAAKTRAAHSNIVIVNHAMLLTDLKVKAATGGQASVLPEYGAVLIDEAHELEEYATNALGSEFSVNSFRRLIQDCVGMTKDHSIGDDVQVAQMALWADLTPGRLDAQFLVDHEKEFTDLSKALSALSRKIKAHVVHGDDKARIKRDRIARRADSMAGTVMDLLLSGMDDLVRWVEVDERKGSVLKHAPLSVAPFLANHLWSQTRRLPSGEVVHEDLPAVLTSATLAVGTNFTFIAERLGLDRPRSFDAGSPFDFGKQAGLFIPDLPDPSQQEQAWQAACAATTSELIRAAGGRALLLFTSRRAMEASWIRLAPMLKGMNLTALKQGDRPNKQLAEDFQREETSVLFALKSFMTGVDFQGDSLRLVVIDRLPFAVPTDVIFKARCDALDRVARNKWVDGSFPRLSIPSMSLTLLQAFGRLIRTKTDRGVVAILDPRLLTKKYGKDIVKILPDATRLHDLDSARSFLADIEAESVL